ncbi:MAG: BtpA/SgcQ family protein [Nannocystaceae bacterium]|nr:BtpA/SgcQ family protein [Nannocystaceae bacterium]
MPLAPRGILGVIHLPAMPGDPQATGGFDAMLAHAVADAKALQEGGIDGMIVENFGSIPFAKGDASSGLPPHQVAAITRVVLEIRQRFEGPVGVNCLRNDARSALGIAAATGASFIRVNVHVGAYVTDQGLIEGQAHATLRSRAQLGADVAILADVLVKHATPLAPLTVEDATQDTVKRGLADGVIVTGRATGAPVDAGRLQTVGDAAGAVPVYVGSGLTLEAAPVLAPRCDGAIVGTAFKHGGQVRAPVDAVRVRTLCDVVRPLLRSRLA